MEANPPRVLITLLYQTAAKNQALHSPSATPDFVFRKKRKGLVQQPFIYSNCRLDGFESFMKPLSAVFYSMYTQV